MEIQPSSPTRSVPLILATFIPRDEQSPPRRRLHFSAQHPAPTAVQIASPLKVTPPWLFLAGGGAGGTGSLPAAAAQRTPFGITSCVVGSARVSRLPSASHPLLPNTCQLPRPGVKQECYLVANPIGDTSDAWGLTSAKASGDIGHLYERSLNHPSLGTGRPRW